MSTNTYSFYIQDATSLLHDFSSSTSIFMTSTGPQKSKVHYLHVPDAHAMNTTYQAVII